MKRTSLFLAISLCLCLIFQATLAQAAGTKLKIGISSGNSEEKTEETIDKDDNQNIEESANTSRDKSDISDSKKQEDSQDKTPKTDSKQSNAQSSGSAEQSMSNEEFLLSCDYKLVTATNARILYEDNYSFAFLEQGTYLRYLRNTDDTLEAEVYLDNTIKIAWVPTHNVVLAATIIKDSDGETVIVNEKDPERDTKIKSGKVLLKEGENPLINKTRIKNVNTLLFDSQNYNYSGLSLEKNNTEKNSNNKKARIAGRPDKNQKITLPIGKSNIADDEDSSLDNEDESSTKLSIPSDEESDINSEISSDDGTMKLSIGGSNKTEDVDNSESNENTSSDTDNSNSMKALATATEETKLYSNNHVDSETLANINSGEEIEVYDLGYAFSKVLYNGMEGYIPTSSIKFEDGNDFAVVINKKGNANAYKDDSLKEKVSKIPIGTVVQVIEESGKTLKVNYNGDSVFVPFDSMQFISRPTSLDRIGTIKSQNENAKINTRINDSKGAAIVEKIPVGEHVTIIKSDEKWFHIATPSGKYAFVQSQFIKEN